ncbi:hypothetical protein DFH07DRAFT_763505 [Mycena maculata]|uniref:Uncharacterized protein n=1 Tax=Mycena maculata TaxID=230809 RepID=A0AAD7P2J1_9AGAR|nr:hypothetical protein DFH07DRAFT_763505 [Mycena maculata]
MATQHVGCARVPFGPFLGVPAKIKAPREQPGGISSTSTTVARVNPTHFIHFGQLRPAIPVEMMCFHFNLRIKGAGKSRGNDSDMSAFRSFPNPPSSSINT